MSDIVQLKENGVPKYLKTHVDAIDGVEGKLVRATGNETILGIKNFKDGLQIGGISAVTDKFASKSVTTTNTTDFMSGSKVIFYRWGRLVVAQIEISNKNANFAGWKNLMPFPSGYRPITVTGWGGTLTNKSNRNPALSVYANSAGISVMVSSTSLPTDQLCSGCVVYFTNDNWPS